MKIFPIIHVGSFVGLVLLFQVGCSSQTDVAQSPVTDGSHPDSGSVVDSQDDSNHSPSVEGRETSKLGKAKQALGGLVSSVKEALHEQESDPSSEAMQEPIENESESASYLQRLQAVMNQAKSAGGSLKDAVSSYAASAYGSVSQSGSDSITQSVTWARQSYEFLKSQGLTTAESSSQWFSQEMKKLETWEYRTLKIAINDPATLEAELNRLGAENWECLSVVPNATTPDAILVFKRRQTSVLSKIPVDRALLIMKLLQSNDR